MNQLEIFWWMVRDISIIRTVRDGRSDSMPAIVLESALNVSAEELAAAVELHEGEISTAAEEFVDWSMSTTSHPVEVPKWYNPDKDMRGFNVATTK